MQRGVCVCQPDCRGLRRGRADARFPHQARLKRSEDFQALFARSATSADSCFVVLVRCSGHGRQARLGLAISKKYARRAVDRSRMKRVVRESFRQRRHCLQGIDLVVLCRRHAVTLPNDRLFSSLTIHWKRVRERLCMAC